jgi:2-dehydropantoate 2-reductase
LSLLWPYAQRASDLSVVAEAHVRIAVIGVGGVGGVIGGLLARSGVHVGFVARGEHLGALQEQGLRIESARGTFVIEPERMEVAEDPAQLAPADVVLVATKSWQVAEMAPRLLPLLAEGGFVVPLQNGVEAAPSLARALGAERVVGGFCAMLAWKEAPGLIKHEGAVLRVVVGERPSGISPRVKELVAQLCAANIDAEVHDNIEGALWEKFLFIAAFGAVAAACRAPVGVVRAQPETRALLTAAMEEIAGLAVCRGVTLPDGAVSRALAHVDGLVPHATASMQRDIQAGRRSELHDQTGAVVRLAAEAGLVLPVNQYLWATLLPQELAARSQ